MRQLALELRDALLEVVDQAERGGVERPLVVRERLDVPAHQLLEDRLDGRAETTPDAGPEAERTVGRHRPETLGLGASREAVVRLAGRPRVGPGTTDLLPERREQRVDVDLLGRRKPVVRRLVRHRASVAPGSGTQAVA